MICSDSVTLIPAGFSLSSPLSMGSIGGGFGRRHFHWPDAQDSRSGAYQQCSTLRENATLLTFEEEAVYAAARYWLTGKFGS